MLTTMVWLKTLIVWALALQGSHIAQMKVTIRDQREKSGRVAITGHQMFVDRMQCWPLIQDYTGRSSYKMSTNYNIDW